MTIKYILGAVVVSMSLLTTYAHAVPTTYVYNGSGEITGVAYLDINGALWDMTLHDVSYGSLYNALGADALYDTGFAIDASRALVSFTNTQNELASTFVGCHDTSMFCGITTVYGYGMTSTGWRYTGYLDYVSDFSGDTFLPIQLWDATVNWDTFTYATWERASQGVPEPSVVLLIASGLMAFGIARRKDRT